MRRERIEAELARRRRQSPRAHYLIGKVAPLLERARAQHGDEHERTAQLARIAAALFEYVEKGEDVSVQTAMKLLDVIE